MASWRWTMMLTRIVALVALTALAAPRAFAVGVRHMEASKAEIKVINESAAALAPTNADLSDRLKQMAIRESGEREARTPESAAVEKQDAQLLKDASVALQPTRPDLAKKLSRYANKENREWKHR